MINHISLSKRCAYIVFYNIIQLVLITDRQNIIFLNSWIFCCVIQYWLWRDFLFRSFFYIRCFFNWFIERLKDEMRYLIQSFSPWEVETSFVHTYTDNNAPYPLPKYAMNNFTVIFNQQNGGGGAGWKYRQ